MPGTLSRLLAVAVAITAVPLAAPAGAAQIMVAPTAVMIDANQRVGSYLVINQSDQPQEITVDFRFGYPASDGEGNAAMRYAEGAAALEASSLQEMVRAFPRQFLLAPGARQTVRLLVQPAAEMEPGVYWTRVVTAATPQTAPVETVTEEGVRAQVVLRLEQVTAVFFRQGEATTGLEVRQVDVRRDPESGRTLLLPDLHRTGNAPWLGTARVVLHDAAGEVVHEGRRTLAVYSELTARLEIPVDDLPAGDYTAELSFRTERSDIPADELVQGTPVVERVVLTLP